MKFAQISIFLFYYVNKYISDAEAKCRINTKCIAKEYNGENTQFSNNDVSIATQRPMQLGNTVKVQFNYVYLQQHKLCRRGMDIT